MESGSVIRTAPTQEINLDPDLYLFLQGANGGIEINPLEFARTSLQLLKNLPLVRDAVLEYFCRLFDSSVASYLAELDMSHNPTQEENTLMEIHSVLCSYVKANPEAWAPIISTWSLELLGSLSSKYIGHSRVASTKNLNDALHLWMSCRATRTLIDLNTQCLTCLMHYNTETCINALLVTSVQHSPNFDWVVAHVGSSFPHTVITRVLSCGLKDFFQTEQGGKAPKINSVVGILGHLAGSHLADISVALLELFQWSFEENPNDNEDTILQKVATVPYILELASLSTVLLKSLSTDVLLSLNCDVIHKMVPFAPKWCNYLGGRIALQELVIHLSLGCSSGGEFVFKLLLDAAEDPYQPVSNNALEFIELLLKEMGYLLHMRRLRIPLLDCIQSNILSIQPLLLSDQPLRNYTACCLLKMLAWQDWNLVTGSLSYMLTHSSNDAQLANLVQLLEESNGSKSLNKAVQLALTSIGQDDGCDPCQFWDNLYKLMKWDLRDKMVLQTTLTALKDNMRCVAKSLVFTNNIKELHTIANVLEQVSSPQHHPLGVQNVLWVTHATVGYFYSCLKLESGLGKLRGCRVANKLFTRLSNTFPAARNTALRALIEIALTSKTSSLFGNISKPHTNNPPTVSLLQENLKQGTSTLMAQKHSSVFHTGIIGFGLRSSINNNSVDEDTIKTNTSCLIAAITACCQAESPQACLDAIITVALLLVELISPDVMYNGLPWPEEDFCKVTVERDLHICSKLKTLPVIWSLLHFIAAYRPTLCYCSVILRAVAAILVSEWSTAAQQKKGIGEDKLLLEKTIKLLSIMSLGQLLPPPLSSLKEAIPHLPPNQVVMLLRECLWNYMRDHVPSPALFTRDSSGVMWRDPTLSRPPRQYTETFRIILQRNIGKLGQLYAQLFFMHNEESQV
uniref:Integrator complex subunit 5 n=1 Tax=Clastoptera arizonana TaxID=38151 RepID=A0A1B6D092_9HEMI